MHRWLLALALLAAPVRAQDDARIQELIRKLNDDSFEARVQAEKDLVAIGPAAAPFLKKAVEEAERRKDQDEVKVRALSALRDIEFAAKALQFYSEPRRVTLRLAEADLAGVLSQLEKQTGVKMDGSLVDTRAKVSIDAADAPLFKVLDDLCRGQDERSYEYREEGVKFQRSRPVSCPAAYEGPFRIRVARLKYERSTDYKTSDAQVQLTLEADWQKYLKPSKKVEIEIRKATDDKGGSLEIQKGEEDDGNDAIRVAGGGRILMRARGGVRIFARMGVEEEAAPQAFTLKGLSAGATRLSIQGLARFSFPFEKTEVAFENPANGESRQTGDVTISLRSQNSGRVWTVTFTRTPGRPEANLDDIENRVDRDFLTALDEEGKEHKGALNPSGSSDFQIFVRGGGEAPEGTPLASFQAVFPTLQNRKPHAIRFKFVSQVFVKSVPFTLKDTALP